MIDTILANLLRAVPLVAQSSSGPKPSIQWAIVLFFVILGLLVSLSPSRRTFEIKKPKDE